jgi:AraC family transcriptional activator of tynA and feaB
LNFFADLEPEMLTDDDLQTQPPMEFDAWRDLLRSHCGGYTPQRGGCHVFSGAVRPVRVSGLKAVGISCNVDRVDRTLSDIRRDGIDRYSLFAVTSGQATFIQNEMVTKLSPGDCAFIDVSRPVSFVISNTVGQFLALQLPRRLLVSHIGLEPRGGSCWHCDTLPVRVLLRLVFDAAEECDVSHESAECYMQSAICDLLGALLASSDLLSYSSHNEKVYKRVCNIVKSQFSNPGIRPSDVASEAGISLRYLQKLFTRRGTTCSRFILSLRLVQAERLLHLRKLNKSGQPLTDIAYACGFQDYPHFARTFRLRFGRSPGSEAGLARKPGSKGASERDHSCGAHENGSL